MYRFSKHGFLEFLFSVLIIAILTSIASSIYLKFTDKARVLTFVGELQNYNSMFVYHALHGVWPENDKVLREYEKKSGYFYEKFSWEGVAFQDITMANGAMHFLYSKELEGKTLTVRPAIPEKYPEGPVILISTRERSGWVIFGEDKTTVEDDIIVRYLK